MPAIVITIDATPFGMGSSSGKCVVYGRAQEMTNHTNIGFAVEIDENDNAAQIQAAFVAAAVAEFANLDITIANNDKKILFSAVS